VVYRKAKTLLQLFDVPPIMYAFVFIARLPYRVLTVISRNSLFDAIFFYITHIPTTVPS